jgi:hypothetical protein
MAAGLFDRDYTKPDAQAVRDGTSVAAGTTGPYAPANTDPKAHLNKFVSDLRQNPGAKDMYNTNVYSAESAQQSQEKIDGLTAVPNFANKGDQALASDWFSKYLTGVQRNLIPPDEMVSVNTISNIQSQQPGQGVGNTPYTAASRINPPGSGGIKVG